MFVGHYAIALIAKRTEPTVNLSTLVFAAMFADFAWCVFLIFGIEQVQFQSGMGAGRYFYANNIALSHSLLMDAVWASLLAFAYFMRKRYSRGAFVIFLVVLSHWLFDFVSHRPDLCIAPGLHTYFGLGLWNSIPATLLVEGGFWVFAILLYVRWARSKSRLAAVIFWGGASLLTLLWLNNIAGPPPPNAKTAPFASLVVFSLTVIWAYWVNRMHVAGPGGSHAPYI